MAKFQVCIQQYVEKIATVEVEANTAEDAATLAKLEGGARAAWTDGDDSYSIAVYAVMQGDKVVWER